MPIIKIDRNPVTGDLTISAEILIGIADDETVPRAVLGKILQAGASPRRRGRRSTTRKTAASASSVARAGAAKYFTSEIREYITRFCRV